jgi:hypothetical protein
MWREGGDHADAHEGAARTGKKIDLLLLPSKYR